MRDQDILNSVNTLSKIQSSNKSEVIVSNNVFTYNGKSSILDCQGILMQARGFNLPEPAGGWDLSIQRYSPLEIDLDSSEWNEQYIPYNKRGYPIASIPMFNMTFWTIIAATKQVPSFLEFTKIYINSYCKIVEKDKIKENKYLYKDGNNHEINSNKTLYFDDNIPRPNHIIQFKPGIYNKLIINQFTVEQLTKRIYNVYASLLRDFVHLIMFQSYGASVYYNSTLDNSGGIDLIVNSVPVRAFTDSKRARKAAFIKETDRHTGTKDSIILKADIYESGDKIILPTDDIIKEILSDISNNTLKTEYIY